MNKGKKQPVIAHVSRAGYAKLANHYGQTGNGPRCKECGGQTWFRSAARTAPSAFVCHTETCKAEIRSA